MLDNIQPYLTVDNIYFWSNFAVLPFWIMLIIVPRSKFNQILINSVIIPLILSFLYIYILYQVFLKGNPIFNIFNLYIGIEQLYTLFSDENFLLIFWLHFISINLFLGNWVSKDGVKYNIPKGWVGVSLVLIYLTGPLGLVFFWFIRIFYSKKLGFHD